MIFKSSFIHLFVICFFSLLLSACLSSVAGNTIFLPIVIEENNTASPMATSQTTIDYLDSYRVIYTTRFTNTNPVNYELITNEYSWQRAQNPYGFNSLNRLTLEMHGMKSRITLQEGYLIDEIAYLGFHGQLSKVDRMDAISTTDILEGHVHPHPILTLNDNNESMGQLGIYTFPKTIGEIILQSQSLGHEVVSGLLTTHYRTIDPEVIFNPINYPLRDPIPSKIQGDFWVTTDNQYVIRFLVDAKGLANGTQHYQYEYIVRDINQDFAITVPE